MKRYFIFLVFIFSVFVPLKYSMGATTTTGFIPGQIWYSKDPFVEGDTVKVYTALWNNGTSSLSAKVEFYDKNVILGSRDVTVPSLQVQEVYVSWKVTSGDHLISAKIISPSVTVSGKKQTISVDNIKTESDKRFVPVVINTIDGTPATSGDIIKSQVDKATSSLDGLVPESISTPVSENVGVVDSFRVDTLKKITDTKAETSKKIDEFKNLDTQNKSLPSTVNKNTKENIQTKTDKVSISEATDKPIAYIKLFFFSILAFVFGSKLVFYSLIILCIFFISRGIYRKIRRN